MRQVIYLDVLAIVNFAANYVLLWAAGRLTRVYSAGWRLALGAAFGTLYLLVLFFPPAAAAAGVGGKFLFSLLMLLIAFAPLARLAFIRLMGYFYFSTVLLAGITYAAFWLTRSAVPYWVDGLTVAQTDLQWWVLALAISLLAGFGLYGWGLVQKRRWQESLYVSLDICFDVECIRVKALLDTGNELTDPLSGKPVAVVEYPAIRAILPAEIRRIFDAGREEDLEYVSECLAESAWLHRFRLLPFASLGQARGVLLGFRPDRVAVTGSGSDTAVREVIVGIYNHRLSAQGVYAALISPDLPGGAAMSQ